MTNQDQPKRPRGRPPRYAGQGKRQNFNFRITEKMRARLIEAVRESGRSLSEEIEFRLTRDFSWEETKGDINRTLAEASAIRSAARIQAIRAAALIVLRETDGRPTRVIVDLETILAEADGLLHGLRSGFVGDSPPPAPEPRMTPEQQQRLLAEIEDLRRQLAAAGSRKPDDDAAA